MSGTDIVLHHQSIMPVTSIIWDYFDIYVDDICKAKCKNTGCKALVSRGGKTAANFTTTNLKNHLKRYHATDFKKFEEANEERNKVKRERDEEASCSTTSNVKRVYKQLNMTSMVDRMSAWKPDDPRRVRSDYDLAEMVCLDLQPFSIVEDVGFRKFVKGIEPRYTLPSRSRISNNLIPDVYERVKSAVMKQFHGMDYISLTTDIWSNSDKSLMSLTGHWINKDFTLHQTTLNASSIPGSHTGEAMHLEFNKMLSDWDLQKEQVHVVLRDNASNAKAAFNLAGVDHQGCFVHTIQLVVHDAIKEQRSVNDMLSISRRIAGKFSHSQLANSNLQKIQKSQGLPEHHIIQDVPTRWNSTFYMLERIVSQKLALVEFASTYECDSMTANQWKLAQTVLETLRPFEVLTREASAKTATQAMVIPSVRMMQRVLQRLECKGIQTIRDSLLESLEKRFSNVEDIQLQAVATFLDPRYKSKFFVKAETEYKVKEWLHDAHAEHHGDPEPEPLNEENEENMDDEEVEEAGSADSVSLGAMYDDFLVESGSDTASTPTLSQEIQSYASDVLLKRNQDPLAWWKLNEGRFRKLAKLARRFLSAPASSVPSERLFSEAGGMYTAKRNRLAPQKAEMMLVIRGNMALLEFKY